MKTVWVRGLRAERGFTLVELLVTSAMTLVVFASMFGAMIAQQQSYSLQIDSSEASQNARAALSIIKHELRMAGWGLSSSTQANFPAVGTCNNDVDRFACNDLADFGSGSR
ncbi:MAG: prepilin-type N-terminal cleavage/methylation domain-containing protein, partial [Myxococcota bacterium]